jgi:hypothetical protein
MITQTTTIGKKTFVAVKVGDTLVILVGDYTYTVLSTGVQEGKANLLLFSRDGENERFERYRFEALVPKAPASEADVRAFNDRWRGTFHEVAKRIGLDQMLMQREDRVFLSEFIWTAHWQSGWPE